MDLDIFGASILYRCFAYLNENDVNIINLQHSVLNTVNYIVLAEVLIEMRHDS